MMLYDALWWQPNFSYALYTYFWVIIVSKLRHLKNIWLLFFLANHLLLCRWREKKWHRSISLFLMYATVKLGAMDYTRTWIWILFSWSTVISLNKCPLFFPHHRIVESQNHRITQSYNHKIIEWFRVWRDI